MYGFLCLYFLVDEVLLSRKRLLGFFFVFIVGALYDGQLQAHTN
jgi:hypothetical protein